MIDQWQGQYVPTCDGCGSTLPAAEDFREAVDRMKAEDWQMIPPTEGCPDWYHFCPNCKEASAEWR